MSAELLARLEAAVSRLEALGAGGAAQPKKGDEMDDASSQGYQAVSDFERFRDANIPKFLAAFEPFPDLKRHKEAFEKAWVNQHNLCKAAALCKKPADQDIVAFLQPSVDAMNLCSSPDRDAANINLQKALMEAAPFLSWPFSPPTFQHVEGMRDSAGLWINRALTDAKTAGDEKLAQVRAFNTALKETLTEFAKFLKEHYKLGLEWHQGGKDFKSYTPGSAPSASAAPAAAAPAPAAAATAAPAGNPFAELQKGLNVTSGLKKVTDDMKTKNQKDLPPVEAPKPKAPVAKTEPVASKPASLVKNGESWYCEWQWNQPSVQIENLTVTQGAYIGNCRNANIYITGKPKGVTLDKCFRTNVYVSEFLSSVELVNCDRCTVYIQGAGGNTYALDKSKGCILNFSSAALSRDPDLVTSNISECNIQNERGEDLIEVAIPEQYQHKIVKNTGKGQPLQVTAHPVSHG
jgi:adenylyl cyclase-associated protein